MKKYRVSKGLKPYVREILDRSFYSCRMQEIDGQDWCYTNASSDTFHRIVQRAKCEKKTEETGIFQVTTKEATNCFVLGALLHQAGKTAYTVIDDRDGSRIDPDYIYG